MAANELCSYVTKYYSAVLQQGFVKHVNVQKSEMVSNMVAFCEISKDGHAW